MVPIPPLMRLVKPCVNSLISSAYFDSDRLKPLAVLSDKRLPQLPNVPTANEQGSNFPSTLWYGVFAPTGTPAAAVVNTVLNKSLAEPAVSKILETQGSTPRGESPKIFAQRIAQVRDVWGRSRSRSAD